MKDFRIARLACAVVFASILSTSILFSQDAPSKQDVPDTKAQEASKGIANDQLLPVVREFKDLIENDPEVYMLVSQMFAQLPSEPPYLKDPAGQAQVRDYNAMLRQINGILTKGPDFNKSEQVGTPFNAMFAWPMCTPAGTSFFLNGKVNAQMKKILNHWAKFLGSPDSRHVLSDDPEKGWLGRDAMAAMPTFFEDFQCDPKKPYCGFASWDDFFTRKLKDGSRPVASPDDDSVIASSCESAPFNLAENVKLRDQFWIKGQPYSLHHILDGDPLAGQFVGGTVYQAFLSALSYHRWHSPVSGKIVKTKLVDGTYFAVSQSEGFDDGSEKSQAYMAALAARALIFIQADNPDIGLMCAVYVGMAEVSSNEITVREGQHVEKGDQLGMFHFGGSTHCLIFRPQVKLEFDLHGQIPSYSGSSPKNIPVRSKLATVVK